MIGHRPEDKDFAAPNEKIREEQPGPANSYSDMGRAMVSADCDLKLWFAVIPAILFIRNVRSEIRSTSALGPVILCEAELAGILLSAVACANIGTPANNRTGTNNRI